MRTTSRRAVRGTPMAWMRSAGAVAMTGLLTVAVGASGAAQEHDYFTYESMMDALDSLDGRLGGRMTVHTIGLSYGGRKIRVVQLADRNAAGNVPDDCASKPALLIEAGMHAREWAGPELCMRLLQTIADLGPSAPIDDIVEGATIWVIPMVNPDGRTVDDQGYPEDRGDPELFWKSTRWHDRGDGAEQGWRTNWQEVPCLLGNSAMRGYTRGIDLNRNFSDGWGDIGAGANERYCNHIKFCGYAPFQAHEANVLRRFVDNRMISMSLSVHSYASTMGSRNDYQHNPDVGDFELRFRKMWNDCMSDPRLYLDSNGGGGGSGQFTSWMSSPSDTAGEFDFGTTRGAVSMLLELPPREDQYDDFGYPYRWSYWDGSNAFHPSARSFFVVVEPGFYSAALYVMHQVRSPWLALSTRTLRPMTGRPADFGLTGSKIADGRNQVGCLDFSYDYGTGAVEVLEMGDARTVTKKVVYRVQDFDPYHVGTRHVRVQVRAYPDGAGLIETVTTDHHLSPGGSAVGVVDRRFTVGRDYTVAIELVPVDDDRRSANDRHVFRFKTVVAR